MSDTRKYCTNCNLEYDFQSRNCCTQCGSLASAYFTLDYRSEDLSRFLANRSMKEYTERNNNEQCPR